MAEEKTIKELQQIMAYSSQFKEVNTTILLYDVYQQKGSRQIANLHTFAPKILDSSFNVSVQIKKISRKEEIISYSSSPSGDIAFTKNMKNIEGDIEQSAECIGIYESAEKSLRVVVLPIPGEMLLDAETEAYDNYLKEKSSLRKKQKLSGKDKTEAQQLWAREDQEKLQETIKQKRPDLMKKLRLSGLTRTLLDKTKILMICNLIEFGSQRLQTIEQYQKEFITIFDTPVDYKEYRPGFIYYSYEKDTKAASQIKHPSVIGIFTIEDDGASVGIQKSEWENEDHFQAPKKGQIKTKLFSQISKQNQIMNKVIKQFAVEIGSIAEETANTLIHTLLISGFGLTESLRNIDSLSCDQIGDKYALNSLILTSIKDNVLQEYFTPERKQKLGVEGKLDIPPSLNSMVLTHEFCNLIGPFLDPNQYNKKEISHNRDQNAMLKEWKPLLRQVCELIKSIKKTENPQSLQRCFNFLCFLIECSRLLKKIANIDIGLSSIFKVLFSKAQPSKDKILKQIIENRDNISKNQCIDYYSIYLALLSENLQSGVVKQVQCELRELRVKTISNSQRMCDGRTLILAIKDLSTIILESKNFISKKREVSILKNQRKLAKLLSCVGKDQISAEIYFKNRNADLAHISLKIAKKNYHGDKRAQKLMEWGQKMQRQLEYELALLYYSEAYSCFKTIQLGQKAIQKKLECRKKIRNEEAPRILDDFVKFSNQDGSSLEDFTSKNDLSYIYRVITNSLVWNPQEQRAVFTNLEDNAGNPTFMRNE